jgi:enoyl-CoA hydratase/carnithine racemase
MIEVRREGTVAEVVLNRPEALNAVSTAFAEELTARMRELAADGSLRAAVLGAAGEKAYCVGADLKERNGFGDAEMLAQRLVFRAFFGSVLDLPLAAVLDVEDAAWRAAALSVDRVEGIRAFNEKRPPAFGTGAA